ncbi:MAG: DUF2796 domain-containing protein [Pseudomonadales bacterium]|nr:DUF2796 domain-containing protein [Pseudomonadales bacterium]
MRLKRTLNYATRLSVLLAVCTGAGVAVAELHDHHDEHDHSSHDDNGHQPDTDHNHAHDHHGGEHHGAHIHGVGHLNIAIENEVVTIYLQTPAADIIGFEHVAETEEEREMAASARNKLNDVAAMFRFSGADCQVRPGSGVEVPASDGEASDVIAEYTFECADGNLPESMAVELSTEFPDLKVLKAVWLTESSQGTKELTARDHVITFR